MVTVRFLNLLRSKYNVEQLHVKQGSLSSIIDQILVLVPGMKLGDFEYAVVFVNQVKVNHIDYNREMINDGDDVVFTHFVGGG